MIHRFIRCCILFYKAFAITTKWSKKKVEEMALHFKTVFGWQNVYHLGTETNLPLRKLRVVKTHCQCIMTRAITSHWVTQLALNVCHSIQRENQPTYVALLYSLCSNLSNEGCLLYFETREQKQILIFANRFIVF